MAAIVHVTSVVRFIIEQSKRQWIQEGKTVATGLVKVQYYLWLFVDWDQCPDPLFGRDNGPILPSVSSGIFHPAARLGWSYHHGSEAIQSTIELQSRRSL